MAKLDWQSVTREDVIKAVELFLSENPEYPSPRSTFLMYDGKKLPAKHIRGMAYKVAHNQELSKNDYTGGMDTKRFFEKLGFEILYTGETEKTQKANTHNNKKSNIASAQIKDKPKTEGKNFIPKAAQDATKLSGIKIAMYLQCDEWQNKVEFNRAMKYIKKSDADILVFPELGWFPFSNFLEESDVFNKKDRNTVYDKCLDFSKELGRAVIISSIDMNNTIFSVYANAQAAKGETKHDLYIKHTMTYHSAFEDEKYKDLAPQIFAPIVFRDHKIGMTICYDCNHALFSRMYGLQGVDIIINSTGTGVVDNKWYKYNQTRAIENQCYTFVTMGGSGDEKKESKKKASSSVYGFHPSGKKLKPHLLNEKEFKSDLSYANSDKTNIPGGIYIYDTASEPIEEDVEKKKKESKKKESKKKEKEKKNQKYFIPVGDIESILQKSNKLEDNLYVLKSKKYNIVFCVADGKKIFSAESFLPLMYSEKLKNIENKRYIIVCRYKNLTKKLYENKLSVVLKVRAMENYCAVILESDIENHCYQTGIWRTSQVIDADKGKYGLDLSRMTGPEAIWKNKDSCKAAWRTNFEWLARECEYIAENHKWSKE